MLGYLSLDIICSSKLTVFLQLRSRKTVRFSEEIMSADKYSSSFLRQMVAIVYLYHALQYGKRARSSLGCLLLIYFSFRYFRAFLLKQLLHLRFLDMT